jgi:hypothetical protein
VLLRPKFGFSPQVVGSLLAVVGPSEQVVPGSAPTLPDQGDEVFLAAALATADQVLVTGNSVHFPAEVCAPVDVLTPAEALKKIR